MKLREFILLSAAMVAGRPSRAQQKAMPVIGFSAARGPARLQRDWLGYARG